MSGRRWKQGADGYLLKSTRPEDLVSAIRNAARGRRALSPELIDGVLADLAVSPASKPAAQPV